MTATKIVGIYLIIATLYVLWILFIVVEMSENRIGGSIGVILVALPLIILGITLLLI